MKLIRQKYTIPHKPTDELNVEPKELNNIVDMPIEGVLFKMVYGIYVESEWKSS